MRERYLIGCDPGQAVDPTAICAVREQDGVCQVGHLERLPLGTTYPGVIERVRRIMAAPPFVGHSELVLDATGVGRPVCDMFIAAGLHPVRVLITGGDETSVENGIHRVPKLHLVSRVQALLHADKMKVQAELTDAPILKSELQDFQATVNEMGRWRFGARVGKHDDLVLAVALACWRAIASRPMHISDEVLRRAGGRAGRFSSAKARDFAGSVDLYALAQKQHGGGEQS